MSQLMSDGVDLMLFGMGFVFVFLALLVLSTTIMSALISKYEPAPTVKPARKARSSVGTDPASDPVLLAVIQDAITQHRARRK